MWSSSSVYQKNSWEGNEYTLFCRTKPAGPIGKSPPAGQVDQPHPTQFGDYLHQQPQRPEENPYSLLVYSTKASDVETVVIDGRVVVRDRRVLTLDEDEILARAAEYRRALTMHEH